MKGPASRSNVSHPSQLSSAPGSADAQRTSRRSKRYDFKMINHAALEALPAILSRWLPGGRIEGDEYVALNPTRVDRNLGSFKINLRTGRWADFATNDCGGDVIALCAYLFNLRQGEAADRLSEMLQLHHA